MLSPLTEGDQIPRNNETKWSTIKEMLDVSNMIVAVICAIAWILSSKVLTPTPLVVPANDSLSMFPNHSSTIEFAVVIAFSVIAQFVLVVCNYFMAQKWPNTFVKCKPFTTYWVFLVAWSLTSVVTNVFKNYVGRARPDFYDVCGDGATYETCKNYAKRNDEFKSWPSGHSSASMSAALFMCLFFQKSFRNKNLLISVCSMLFICLGIFVGATRIRDFRHHPDDVLAGYFVGFLVTLVTWKCHEDDFFEKDEENEGKVITI